MLFLDQSHEKQVVGGSGHNGSFSRKVYRVALSKDLKIVPKRRGGRMPQRKKRIIPKYPQEARACFGVAAPTVAGKRRPQMTKSPFNYTLKKLVSVKEFNKRMKKEMAYRRGMSRGVWKDYKGDNPYEERFGTRWTEEIKRRRP